MQIHYQSNEEEEYISFDLELKKQCHFSYSFLLKDYMMEISNLKINIRFVAIGGVDEEEKRTGKKNCNNDTC